MAIENTSRESIAAIVGAQRDFFRSGATLDREFHTKQLKRLLDALKEWEKPLYEALWADLHKSKEEAFLTELSIVMGEIKNHLKHLKKWMRREKYSTPIKMTPSRSYVVSEPLGSALIIAPWNYPVQLLLNPLVGAISAGCTAVLKPSPYVPTVSKVIEQMIEANFDEKYIAVAQGNRDVNTALLEQKFDIIFFTGSPALARSARAWRQEPLHSGQGCRPEDCGTPYCVGQDPQRGSDLHRSRLSVNSQIAGAAIHRGVQVSRSLAARQRCEEKPPLCASGKRPSL